VAVEDLSAVRAAGFGAAVGVKDQLPASSVDTDVVVILARQNTIFDRCFATVLLVAQVVHIAVGGGAAAPGPGAGAVAEEHSAADMAGDGAAVTDVEREAGGVVGLVEQALAQGRGDAGRAGH